MGKASSDWRVGHFHADYAEICSVEERKPRDENKKAEEDEKARREEEKRKKDEEKEKKTRQAGHATFSNDTLPSVAPPHRFERDSECLKHLPRALTNQKGHTQHISPFEWTKEEVWHAELQSSDGYSLLPNWNESPGIYPGQHFTLFPKTHATIKLFMESLFSGDAYTSTMRYYSVQLKHNTGRTEWKTRRGKLQKWSDNLLPLLFLYRGGEYSQTDEAQGLSGQAYEQRAKNIHTPLYTKENRAAFVK
ncbi:hypothetical protein N7530_009626 [Penicillium desertorum]|uniref:Uncharacterized protein n=1 Tax=Penicillium desertorum TaxID=1303715 RepID=A0A9W9WIU8_9EURO|nr:hypothetical protein N7530_009626 [Penicillium desertorum]